MAPTKLSTSFSKASFVSRDQGEEVDLDDPDFWKKAIGLVEQAAPEEKEEEVCLVGVNCHRGMFRGTFVLFKFAYGRKKDEQ